MVFDSILPWVLVAVPVTSGFVVILGRRHTLGVLLILFGILVAIQQARATKASAREQEELVNEISDRVAAKTSADVTSIVAEQYRQVMETMIKINGQIQKLQVQVSPQAKNPVINKKTPLKGGGANESAPTGAFAAGGGEDVRLSWQPESSTRADAPYAARIRIEANVPINPVRLAIKCDVPLKGAEVGSGPTTFDGSSGIHLMDPSIFVIDMATQGLAPLRPDTPLIFVFYSDRPINVVEFERKVR